MFYSIWLLAAALAGWVSGKIAGDNGFGTGADILLGITGAFVVRWSLEKIGISLQDVYLLLFSIWGAAAFPAAVRFGVDRTIRQKLAPDSKAERLCAECRFTPLVSCAEQEVCASVQTKDRASIRKLDRRIQWRFGQAPLRIRPQASDSIHRVKHARADLRG